MIATNQTHTRRLRGLHPGSALITLFILTVLGVGGYEAYTTFVAPKSSLRAQLWPAEAEPAQAVQARKARWVTIEGPVQTYWLNDRRAWVAMPGERYEIVHAEEGWLLARWEGDPPDKLVWIQRHPWVNVGDA